MLFWRELLFFRLLTNHFAVYFLQHSQLFLVAIIMLQTHFTNLYYQNFSQTALISSSTRPKAKTSFSKEFPHLPLCTNNEFNKITDPAISNFLNKSMPILNNYPPLCQRQIGIRLSKFKPSIINISGNIKYAYTKKLESYRAPEYLNFQAYSLYVVYRVISQKKNRFFNDFCDFFWFLSVKSVNSAKKLCSDSKNQVSYTVGFS